MKTWSNEIKYDGDTFEIEFDINGALTAVRLLVGSAIKCGFIDVTAGISEKFKKECDLRYFERTIGDDDYLYDCWKDDQLFRDNDGGDAA